MIEGMSRCDGRSRPSLSAFTALLVAALQCWICLGHASNRSHDAHLGGGGAHPLHLLPYCRHILGNSTQHDQHAMRDVIQTMQYQRRLMREHEITLERRNINADKPGWTKAYNDSLSDDEHRALLAKHKALHEGLQKTATEMLEELQKIGLVRGTVSLKQMTNCVMGRLNPHLFPYQPTVSFMLQYYGRPWAIKRWVEQLQRCGNHTELVVNVDNEDEHEAWSAVVNSTKGYVVPVFSANIHEPRGYNRLSELARGQYLVIFQDDEYPSDQECKWLADTIAIFERWPSIGAIGHRGFVWDKMPQDYPKKHHPNNGMFFRDPVSKVPMQFVDRADFAPFTVRKAAFRHLGGLDETAGEPGECGHWADWDLCNRLWAAGWQLAFHGIERESDKHDSGTHRPEKAERCWGRQGFLTGSHFQDRWDWGHTLTRHVRMLNLRELERVGEACPFAGSCNLTSYEHPAR